MNHQDIDSDFAPDGLSVTIRGKRYATAEVSRVLDPFVSDERKNRIENVLLNRTRTVTPVVDGVHDMGNVSAVMRSAEALGYQTVHVIETADEFKNSPRTTQGADKWLDVFRWPTARACAERLRHDGYHLVVTHLEAQTPIQEIDFTERTAIVFGNEANGVSEEMLTMADERCILPMKGFVESFNISVAAAIILYHAFLQRVRGGRPHGDLTEAEKDALRARFYMKSVKEPAAIVSRMATTLAVIVMLLTSVSAVVRAEPPSPDSARVTYIGNEGFLIEVGNQKVLIDALYRTGVPGYVVHPPSLRRSLERALPPYDSVDVVLATHSHADHFDPESVGSYLVSSGATRFLSTPQAVSQLQSAFPAWRHVQGRVTACEPTIDEEESHEIDGIRVTALNLHHGENRPVENLGFLIEIGEWSFLHVGDTEVPPDDLASRGLAERDIDIFFVPYWFLAYSGWDDGIVPAVGEATLIPMHMPPPDDPRGYMSDIGGFNGAVSRIVEKYPDAVVLTSDDPTITFN